MGAIVELIIVYIYSTSRLLFDYLPSLVRRHNRLEWTDEEAQQQQQQFQWFFIAAVCLKLVISSVLHFTLFAFFKVVEFNIQNKWIEFFQW